MSTGFPLPDSSESSNNTQPPATPANPEETASTPVAPEVPADSNPAPESTAAAEPTVVESTEIPSGDSTVIDTTTEPVPVVTESTSLPTSAEIVEPAADEALSTPVVADESAAEETAPVADASGQVPGSSQSTMVTPPTSVVDTVIAAAAAAQSADEQAQRPRVRLNPTNDGDARSLGSVDVAEKPIDPETGKPVPTAEPKGPVEIPRDADIDADLEAQISAAMESGASTTEQAVVPVDATPAPVADAPTAADAETPVVTEETLTPGTRLKGVVQQVHGENVFLDVGLRSSAVVPLRQFAADKQPEVGATLEVAVANVKSEEGIIEANMPRGKQKVAGNWDAVAVGQVVDAMVKKSNKGGLEVTISNLRGFLPSSQIELGYAEDLESYVGQKLTVQITEVNPKKRNLVVSRKALLMAERKEKEAEFFQEVSIGQVFTGIVKTIKDYGAFIDLGAVDGFLHIGEMSWSRINHPNELLKPKQEIEVKVLTKDEEKRRIGLSMRQLTTDPWSTATDRYAQGSDVTGTVTRTADFGAFVRLEQNVEGLVHISQLAWRRVGKVTEVLNVGDSREFRVLEVDPRRKRISLSLKALEAKPESAKPDPTPEDAPAPRRKRTGPLRGGREGVDGSGGGGLFGNPNDFGT